MRLLDGSTITALATPRGRSAIGVVRLSGPAAWELCLKVFAPAHGLLQPGQFTTGALALDGQVCDRAVCIALRAPHTYTGEDLVEFSLHGNPVLLDALVARLCAAGARPAEEGEFTLRAFLNGKLSLSEAEGVVDVIHARSLQEAALVQRNLSGNLSRQFAPLRQDLMHLAAALAVELDVFEDDAELSAKVLEQELERLRGSIEQASRQASLLQRMRRGYCLAIVGEVNAGKSTLFNALLKEDRAIVHETEGTTRDTLDAALSIGGFEVRLFDTAGLRLATEPVELAGIRRTQLVASEAELIIAVFDGSQSLPEQQPAWLSELPKRRVLLALNKADLPNPGHGEPSWMAQIAHCTISAKQEVGLEQLRDLLSKHLREIADETLDMYINERQAACLDRALQALVRAVEEARGGCRLDILAAEIAVAMRALDRILGQGALNTPEDLLSEVFSRFCVGK